ncbi:hypothetical protein TUN199_01985 [Pyrenophora tritici-repentis]|nr:hypothetical protein Alg130_05010 [Pyrenophora tritici-repentis]KAI0610704.1 hypothetical protein TUN205_05039 [Pyrenophora tritici-repentis]KAI0625985.1 hypothetical protein TUN199_01985 [Pyrenophora tritici-repentis]
MCSAVNAEVLLTNWAIMACALPVLQTQSETVVASTSTTRITGLTRLIVCLTGTTYESSTTGRKTGDCLDFD